MAPDEGTYPLADEMIDGYGPEAGDYAAAMLRLRLEQGDLLAAGAWLAIEDLARLHAGETRH